jgi:hypothetical protein
VLLVSGPLLLLAALGVLVKQEAIGLALALLAGALVCALLSVAARRAGMRRPNQPLRGAAGLETLARRSRYQLVPGGELPPLHAPIGSTFSLAAHARPVEGLTQGVGLLASDPRVVVAWAQNGSDVPRIDFVAPDVSAAFEDAFGGQAVVLDHPDLIRSWRARVHDGATVDSLLGPEMRVLLNAHDRSGAVIRCDGTHVAAFFDPEGEEPDLSFALGFAMMARMSLPHRLLTKADGSPVYDAVAASQRERTATRNAALGPLATRSRVRGTWLGLQIAFTFLTLFAVAALFMAVSEDVSSGVMTTVVALAAVGAVGLGISIAADQRLARRQRRIAAEIRRAAETLALRYTSRVPAVENGWLRSPFSSLRSVQASPGATGTVDGRECGMAYLEGDAGVGALSARTFTSRIAWIDVGRQLPAADFVREDFAQRVAALIGGTDVDVESYEFNRAWRVRADDERAVHGMLQPVMIALLVDVADAGLAIHTDGTKVVVWDDGRAGEVDMVRRLDVGARFAKAIPGFVGDPATASG